MRHLTAIFLALPLALAAQGPDGSCSITLLSEENTVNQGFCIDPVHTAIEPIVYLIQGTGLEVTDLPPGVSTTVSNDTLTISGTINTVGIWHPHVTLEGGCTEFSVVETSQLVDMQLSCTVVNDSVMLAWPGVNALGQDGGTFFIYVYNGVDLLSSTVVFTPCPDFLTIGGLPQNIPLTFRVFLSGGFPTCTTEIDETTCTIMLTGVTDEPNGDLPVRAVPNGDVLQLSASTVLQEVRIYDMLGTQVVGQMIQASTANIPIAPLSGGAYVLRVVGVDGRIMAQRFVRE